MEIKISETDDGLEVELDQEAEDHLTQMAVESLANENATEEEISQEKKRILEEKVKDFLETLDSEELDD